MANKLRITLVKSPIGYNKKQRAMAKSLGLGRLGSQVVRSNSSTIRGMVNKIIHLVEVEEIEVDESKTQAPQSNPAAKRNKAAADVDVVEADEVHDDTTPADEEETEA